MPSSSLLQGVTNRQLISTSFQTPHSFHPSQAIISTLSLDAIGIDFRMTSASTVASTAYPASSRILAYPFAIADPFTVQKVFWVNGTTATTDSADVGVFSESGAILYVSGGSTAIANANVVQEKDCTDTVLPPGRYWCAYIQSGTTATPMMAPSTVVQARSMGVAQMAGSGSTLAAPFTPAAIASAAGQPICGIAGRTKVA